MPWSKYEHKSGMII